MKRYSTLDLRLGPQLVLAAAGAAIMAAMPAHALMACKINTEAKNVPIYDRPGGAEMRRTDVDPTWIGGPGLTAHQKDGNGDMELWVEVKDKAGAPVGFFKLGEGGAGCSGGL